MHCQAGARGTMQKLNISYTSLHTNMFAMTYQFYGCIYILFFTQFFPMRLSFSLHLELSILSHGICANVALICHVEFSLKVNLSVG